MPTFIARRTSAPPSRAVSSDADKTLLAVWRSSCWMRSVMTLQQRHCGFIQHGSVAQMSSSRHKACVADFMLECKSVATILKVAEHAHLTVAMLSALNT